MAYFQHNNEWKLGIIIRISLCYHVIYVFVDPMNRNNPHLFQFPKEKKWLSNIIHHSKIRVLYPLSSNISLLNQLTCSKPRCSLRSHSLVCSENYLFIVEVEPFQDKEL